MPSLPGSKEISLPRRGKRGPSLVGKSPWRRKWPPNPVSLSGKSRRQRSLGACSPWGHKESETAEQLNCHQQTRMKAGARTPGRSRADRTSQSATDGAPSQAAPALAVSRTPVLGFSVTQRSPLLGRGPPPPRCQNVPNAAPARSQAGPTPVLASSTSFPSSRPHLGSLCPPGAPVERQLPQGRVLVGWGRGQAVTKHHCLEGWKLLTALEDGSGAHCAERSGVRWGLLPALAWPTRGRVVLVAAGGSWPAWGRPLAKRRSSETLDVTPLWKWG